MALALKVSCSLDLYNHGLLPLPHLYLLGFPLGITLLCIFYNLCLVFEACAQRVFIVLHWIFHSIASFFS